MTPPPRLSVEFNQVQSDVRQIGRPQMSLCPQTGGQNEAMCLDEEEDEEDDEVYGEREDVKTLNRKRIKNKNTKRKNNKIKYKY